MAFLSFLLAQLQAERVGFSRIAEIDLHGVGFVHAESHFFGIAAHIIVAHREAGAEDRVVDAMQGGSTEFVLFRKSRQRRGRRVGRNTKDDVVVGINFLLEADHRSIGRHGLVGEVEVAAAGDFVGVDAAALQAEFLHDAGVKRLVEKVYRVRLDRQLRVFEKGKILHLRAVGQVDEDAYPLARARFECAFEKVSEIEGRINAARGLLLNSR